MHNLYLWTQQARDARQQEEVVVKKKKKDLWRRETLKTVADALLTYFLRWDKHLFLRRSHFLMSQRVPYAQCQLFVPFLCQFWQDISTSRTTWGYCWFNSLFWYFSSFKLSFLHLVLFRSTIEETYARSMTKLAKSAGNFSPLGWVQTRLRQLHDVWGVNSPFCAGCWGVPRAPFCHPRTFAPVWDVFKSSTEKLASCHMELVRKLQELIKDVQKYVEEQAKAHKKVRKYKL